MTGNCCCHDTDGACSCDQDILTYHIKGKCCMNRISQGIKDGVELLTDGGIAMPCICCRNYQILSKRTVSVHAYTLGIFAEVLHSCQTVTAFSTDDMTLTGYQIAYLEAFYVLSNLYNLSYILMTCSQTNGNRVLCPLIPVINMYVCSTDRRFVNFNLHIIFPHHRYRYLFHPETYVCFFLYQCPHHFTHYLFLLNCRKGC